MSIRRDPRMLNALGEPVYVVDYRDEHGLRKRERTNATTMKEARLAEAAILTRIEKAKNLERPVEGMDRMTFEKFVDQVYLPAIETQVKGGTYERYENIARHLKDYFGKMTLASIKPMTIDEYFKSRGKEITKQGRPPGAGELRNRRFQLRAIFRHAMKKLLVQGNPVDASDRIRYTPNPKAALTRDQEEKLLAAAPEWLRPIIVMGIYGGMRRAEITSMRWEHVRDGMIYIPAENTKTGKERSVPITSEMEAALATLAKRKLSEGSPGWVFWNAARKSPYNPNSVTTTIQDIVEDLDFKTTFHATRVTMVTDARQSGKITDGELMAITGHSTLRMLDHYTKIKSADLKGRTEGLRRRKDGTRTSHDASEGSAEMKKATEVQ